VSVGVWGVWIWYGCGLVGEAKVRGMVRWSRENVKGRGIGNGENVGLGCGKGIMSLLHPKMQ